MLNLTAEDAADARRWALSALTVALAVCGSSAVALWDPTEQEQIEPAEPAGAIMVDFAPEAVAPTQEMTDLPPGPDQVAAEATPPPVAVSKPADEPPPPDIPQIPAPDVALAPPPEPTPQQEAEPPRVAVPVTTAPNVVADRLGAVAAAPTEGVPDPRKSQAVVTWRTQILAAIEKNKRYPEAARSQRQQGVATVSFLLDHDGRVSDARVIQGSGAKALDDEALAILHRAEPFPAPPSVLTTVERVAIKLPIRFATK